MATAQPVSWKAWHWEGGGIRSFSGNLPLADRGFRYGQHVFESIAIRKGKVLLAAEHLALLAASASCRGLPWPRSLAAALRHFLETVSPGDGMLRLYLTAGPGAPAAPVRKPGCYLTWEATRFPSLTDLDRGYRLTLLEKPFSGEGWGIKSGNYGPHLEAYAAVHAAGADEGIVLDGRKRLLSCAMSNLLLWMPASRSGKPPVLCTPRRGAEVRPGAVLEWCHRYTPVVERNFRASDLTCATALAVTNSRLGVMPVIALDGRKLSDPSLARTLAHEYLRFHGLFRSA